MWSAPITEELFKGLGVFGIFYFGRRQFDGVVDAIIYASFIALREFVAAAARLALR